MSSKVRELLDFIKPLGKLHDTIEIEGENKKTKEETKISVNSDDYTRMDAYGQENEIFGVNVVLKKDDTRIEFVHDDRGWAPYTIKDEIMTYKGKGVKSQFSKLMRRTERIMNLKSEPKPKGSSYWRVESRRIKKEELPPTQVKKREYIEKPTPPPERVITNKTWVDLGPEGETWIDRRMGYGPGHTCRDLLLTLQEHGTMTVGDLGSYSVFADMDLLKKLESENVIKLYEKQVR